MNPDEYPDDLVTLAERLRTGRPAPSVALRRQIQEVIVGAREFDAPDPRRTTTLIAAFGAAGTLLLAAGAVITFL
jgi:hypothetical protein